MSKLEQAKQALNLEFVASLTAKEVMTQAWYLAKLIAGEFGVSPKSLLSSALKKVWKSVVVTVSIFNAYESRQTLAKIGFEFCKETKAWVKTMKLNEFKAPSAVKFGRGFITTSDILRAYNNKHSLKF